MTFSSPPTESALYLPIGMQSNRTPCEFYLSPNLLYRHPSCQTGLKVFHCRHVWGGFRLVWQESGWEGTVGEI